MVLAYGALEPLVVAAAALSRGVLVAAAGVVVVLAILLVFVMVLRGGGSSRQKASGLDYDAQQGPMGQPHAPAGAAPWSGDSMGQMGPMGQMGGQMGRMEGMGSMGPMGGQMGQMGQMDDRFDSMGQGRSGAPQQAPGWGANFGEPAQAGNWSADANAPAAGHWNDQMAPAGGQTGGQMGQMGGLNDWPPSPAQGRPGANTWDMPSGGGAPAWNGANGAAQASPATRPGAGGNPAPWDAPAQPSPWDAAPAAPSQPQWAPPQPAAPSQPQWSGQSQGQPQWAAPSQPQWTPQPDAGMAGMGYPAPQRGGFGPRLVERKPDGREFDLNKDRLTIGRHRESDVFLEDLAVSRLHTTINRDPSGRYILRDENSANGTYVNGQRVSEQVLNDGDEVQVGQTVLVFHQR